MKTRLLAVLAGGRAERLGGVIKPLLVRPDGSTLIEHLITELAPLVDETLIVAPLPLAHLFGRNVVEDPGEGPGLALAVAARRTECDRILLAAADLVSPSAALAERLLSSGGDAAVVSIDGELQPVFAAYGTMAVRAIDPPPKSLRAILFAIRPRVIEARELSFDELAAFDDVDTEDDLARHRLSREGVPTWQASAPVSRQVRPCRRDPLKG